MMEQSSMYVHRHVCMYESIYLHIYVCMKGYLYVYMYVCSCVSKCIYMYKLATVVKGDLKAPLSIATTLRSGGGRYFISLIAPFYT